jgi:tRNA-dependent cyclodipeptide synthase
MKAVPIIGVSPGNSFFTDNEVENLLEQVFSKYTEAVIFIPDIPAQNTYKALGYDEKDARRKAILKGNNLRNKFQRMGDRMGIQRETLSFVDWKKMEKDERYQNAFSDIRQLYTTNDVFQKSAQKTTFQVLQNYDANKEWSDDEIEIGVEYLLCELAYMQSAPEILGCEKVLYVYNKRWPVYEDLISGVFDKKERKNQHFWLIESKKQTFSPITYRSAWDRIQKTKIIRAGYFPCLNRFMESPSEFSGFMYDVFLKIVEREGWTIDWVEKTGYGVLIDRLSSGVYDIFCSTVWPTPERKNRLPLLNPCLQCRASCGENPIHRV